MATNQCAECPERIGCWGWWTNDPCPVMTKPMNTEPIAPMPYSLELTAEEYCALDWLEGRGYSGDLIKHATLVDELPDGSAVLRFRESDAWQVQEAYESDPDAFTACAGESLRAKMYRFLDGIV